MQAKKTKSGKWTCCGYYVDADGKTHRPRFTADRKKDAERMAEAFSLEHKGESSSSGLTFKKACELYIAQRNNVISPSTIADYIRFTPRYFDSEFGNMKLSDITGNDVQVLINELSARLAPKTILNIHGFISSVLGSYKPELKLRTTLPQQIKANLYTPTDADVQILLEMAKGTKMEIPILLAAMGSLRRSEIAALTVDDVHDGFVAINKAMVKTKDNTWQVKITKSTEGTRTSFLPKEVTDRIQALAPEKGSLTGMNPTMISSAFQRLLRKSGLPHFRFHDLRAYWASVLHYLGVPDRYVQQWGGWKDVTTLQKVYSRPMKDKVPEIAELGIAHFQKMIK